MALLPNSFCGHYDREPHKGLLSSYQKQNTTFQLFVLQFTIFVRAPIHCLIKAKEIDTLQLFFYVFHGTMDAPNEEFRTFVIGLYAEYRKGGPTKALSMLDLLDQFDTEYNRINNLGHWTKKEDSQILALSSSLQNLQGLFFSPRSINGSHCFRRTYATTYSYSHFD